MTKSEQGILSEWRVAYDRTMNFGDKLLAHRFSTAYAELDLVVRSALDPKTLLIIEVKTWLFDLWKRDMISPRQQRRLERARLALEVKSAHSVQLLLAVVTGSQIRYFHDLGRE